MMLNDVYFIKWYEYVVLDIGWDMYMLSYGHNHYFSYGKYAIDLVN